MKRLILLLFLVPAMLVAQTDAALEAARKKLEARNFAGANADLSKLIETNPRNKAAFSLRGQVRMQLRDFYGAIGDFNFALEIDSTFAEALNFRGESKINLGDDEGAILRIWIRQSN
ncbi:MAG: hypothetical protein U5K54_16735 [Cytophagales bacterium]|nr:hypothetical protein [Cytophagales bacterium]